jgi:hypothetical protein
MSTRLLTASEVASMLGVPKSWLYERWRRGLIPTVELGALLRRRQATRSGHPRATARRLDAL